jgi:hypothetical protein
MADISSLASVLASADIPDVAAWAVVLASQLAAVLATVDDAALLSALESLLDSPTKLGALEAAGHRGSERTSEIRQSPRLPAVAAPLDSGSERQGSDRDLAVAENS